ncbi:iron-sulfur cluster assembly scaffold protein [Croceicoccus ponticola]|uniref:Iron-sulfur cluster assembly scaffold protein n=1 Tax=Croceicoccus ponticola TaxID=2217664 RepID=A0A437H0L0_9SPHN|nr:iron-sulfur cluster assembly scaffold protein [Croceicoccus ponticola]RVQ69119.1 iron-sulfur cluster assembly scaffold protein [Croceicoccus ponticola]
MSGHRLYTPEVLAAAVSLAEYPLAPDLVLRGEARSASCGSRIELGLELDDAGRIARIGVASRACAIGQASAAIFAKGASGLTGTDLVAARETMAAWLGGSADMPDWPGLDLVASARDYPARHGAMMLAWNAACDALRKPSALSTAEHGS